MNQRFWLLKGVACLVDGLRDGSSSGGMMSAGDSAGDQTARLDRYAQDLRDRADRAEVRAKQYEKGRQGELAVAAELERLRSYGYAYVADIRWPGTTKANVDFLAFGPAGAFVIDAKNWSGNVTVNGGVLRQNSYRRDRETDKVHRMATDLDALLVAPTGTCRPMICLTGQPTVPVSQCGPTYVLGLGSLVSWLGNTPVYWDLARVTAIADWIPSVLTSASPGRTVTVHRPLRSAARAHDTRPDHPDAQLESSHPGRERGRHRRDDKGLYGHLR